MAVSWLIRRLLPVYIGLFVWISMSMPPAHAGNHLYNENDPNSVVPETNLRIAKVTAVSVF